MAIVILRKGSLHGAVPISLVHKLHDHARKSCQSDSEAEAVYWIQKGFINVLGWNGLALFTAEDVEKIFGF